MGNPYVGPRTFLEEDSSYFFGRDREARNLLSFIISEPLILFYAKSGAGKSSLLNTRIIPGLREKGFTVLPRGRVSGFLPEGIDKVANIYSYNLLLHLDDASTDPPSPQTTLTAYLQAKRANVQNPDQDWVLIIDQFEEIITTHTTQWEEREAFFYQLSQAITNDPRLWVVLAMREDHVTGLDPYTHILPEKLRARFYMQPLNTEAALAAIMKPAESNGRFYTPAAAKMLIDNLRQIQSQEKEGTHLGEFVAPVQLQVVCQQLWNNLPETQTEITVEDVESVGDVDIALKQFYERAVTAVLQETDVSEIYLRNWFDHNLITESETRGLVYRGRDETDGLANAAIDTLESLFLLHSMRRTGGIWYELIHDRMVRPILQANREWRLGQSPLIQTALTWYETGRTDDSLLYVGNQLQEITNRLEGRVIEPIVADFLAASKVLDQQQAEKEAARQRELEDAKKLAEAEFLRAQTEAEAAQKQRQLTRILSLSLVLLVGLIIVTYLLNNQANNLRKVAELAAEERSTTEAEKSTSDARLFGIQVAQTQAAVAEQLAEADAAATSIAATIAFEDAAAECQYGIDIRFLVEDLWDPEKFGCPTGDANIFWAAWQPFQNNQHMIWREGLENQIFVFFNEEDQKIWEEFPDNWEDTQTPEVLPTLQPNAEGAAFVPIRGFGFLWRTEQSSVAEPLGLALDRERGFCAFIQEFESGFILLSDVFSCRLFNDAASLDFGLNWMLWYETDTRTIWDIECSTCLMWEASDLVRNGDIKSAISKMDLAEEIIPINLIGPAQYKSICWHGFLWYPWENADDNSLDRMMKICEIAIELTNREDLGSHHDGFGLALALTGELLEASEKFNAYYNWGVGPNELSRADNRVDEDGIPFLNCVRFWRDELEAGRNPFDEETLTKLRTPEEGVDALACATMDFDS